MRRNCAYLEAYRIEVQVPPRDIVCPQPIEGALAEPVEVEPPLPTTPESANVLMPTGMPGKPNLVAFVVEEANRRLADGKVWLKLRPFAESLRAWWEEKRKTYTPVQRSLTVGSIENAVRHLPCWRERKTKA